MSGRGLLAGSKQAVDLRDEDEDQASSPAQELQRADLRHQVGVLGASGRAVADSR